MCQRSELWRTKNIDRVEDVATEDITMDNLAVRFSTGCSVVHGSGMTREITYRQGFATRIGNIEKECWKELAMQAVKNELGDEFFRKVVSFIRLYGTRTQQAAEVVEALDICTSRRFESDSWVQRRAFDAFTDTADIG